MFAFARVQSRHTRGSRSATPRTILCVTCCEVSRSSCIINSIMDTHNLSVLNTQYSVPKLNERKYETRLVHESTLSTRALALSNLRKIQQRTRCRSLWRARRDCQSLDRSLHIFRKAVEARLLYASPNFTSLTPFFTFVIVPGNSSDRDRRFQPFRERANPSMRASSSRRVASKASSTHEARTTMNLKRLPERIIITYTAVLEGMCYSLRRTDTHVIDLWDR